MTVPQASGSTAAKIDLQPFDPSPAIEGAASSPPIAVPREFKIVGAAFLAFAATAMALASLYGLAFVVPTENVSRAIGVHYVVPFVVGIAGYAILQIVSARTRRNGASSSERWRSIASDSYFLLLFVGVIYLHFHIKMWMPLINPTLHDEFFFATDGYLSWLIALAQQARAAVAFVVPNVDVLYQAGFLGMFAMSLWFHAAGNRRWHFQNMTAILIMEMMGALSYLAAPAVGPFIFEAGPNVLATAAQQAMLDSFRGLVAAGPEWLTVHGGDYFTGPPAAMPSLHIAGAWIITYYAIKARSIAMPLMAILFGWIAIESVVSRWHYVIDLPVGLLLATLAIVITNRIYRSRGV